VFNFSLSSSSNPPPIQLSSPKEISPQTIIAEPKDGSAVAPKEGAEGENRAALFTQQQQLINQFMHLNIQLLSRKLENLEQIDRLPRAEEAEATQETRNAKKKMYPRLYAERRRTAAATPSASTTRRECAATATTNTDARSSRGTARTRSCTPTECAKTATLTATTESVGKKEGRTNPTTLPPTPNTQAPSKKKKIYDFDLSSLLPFFYFIKISNNTPDVYIFFIPQISLYCNLNKINIHI
jgi:DNA-binding protein H-NS